MIAKEYGAPFDATAGTSSLPHCGNDTSTPTVPGTANRDAWAAAETGAAGSTVGVASTGGAAGATSLFAGAASAGARKSPVVGASTAAMFAGCAVGAASGAMRVGSVVAAASAGASTIPFVESWDATCAEAGAWSPIVETSKMQRALRVSVIAVMVQCECDMEQDLIWSRL